MRVPRSALLCLATAASLSLAAADAAVAQKAFSRGPSTNIGASSPTAPAMSSAARASRGRRISSAERTAEPFTPAIIAHRAAFPRLGKTGLPACPSERSSET